MKKKFIIMILSISVLLVACNNDSSNNALNKDGNEPKDIKELVEDYSGNRTTDNTASITSTQLIITDSNDKESVYNLPEQEFFVSIAPFVSETHPCEIHSLTGCQGEMDNESFEIYIEDMDGNVVLDDTVTTEANGFIDLWLPRDQTFNVSIYHDGKQVDSEISTFKEDGTCITTMQLL